MADKTEVNYQEMEQVIRKFQKEEADMRQLLQGLNRRADALHGDNWIGRGADKFHSEMEGLVLPAVNRLIQALDAAGNTAKQILDTYRRAEEESGNGFKNLNLD
jgi:WXG100 family type VII secretion target